MWGVAYTDRLGLMRDMSSRPPKPGQLTEAQRLGMALRGLRRRYDLSQARAAEMANTRQQTWQRWESGENDALLKSNLQRRVVAAIGASIEEFQMEIARFDGLLAPTRQTVGGMTEREPSNPYAFPLGGRPRAGPGGVMVYDDDETETIDLSQFLGADTRVLRLAGEGMVPYAEPGGFVTYNLKRYPRRGQGCVIEMKHGEFHVKRYEGVESETLIVTELHPTERRLEFDMEDVKGIYAVGLRGD